MLVEAGVVLVEAGVVLVEAGVVLVDLGVVLVEAGVVLVEAGVVLVPHTAFVLFVHLRAYMAHAVHWTHVACPGEGWYTPYGHVTHVELPGPLA